MTRRQPSRATARTDGADPFADLHAFDNPDLIVACIVCDREGYERKLAEHRA
jgi:hypothetical protein